MSVPITWSALERPISIDILMPFGQCGQFRYGSPVKRIIFLEDQPLLIQTGPQCSEVLEPLFIPKAFGRPNRHGEVVFYGISQAAVYCTNASRGLSTAVKVVVLQHLNVVALFALTAQHC